MKYFLILIMFISGSVRGQDKIKPLTSKQLNPEGGNPILYGYAGIIQQKKDSSKIFYKRYLELKKKGISDSNNIYYKKLKK